MVTRVVVGGDTDHGKGGRSVSPPTFIFAALARQFKSLITNRLQVAGGTPATENLSKVSVPTDLSRALAK